MSLAFNAAARRGVVVCNAEFDGAGWLFGPIALLVGPRRMDLAGGVILLGEVTVELNSDRPASCRTPSFLQYAVSPSGQVMLESGRRFRELRSAVRMDRHAEACGAIGINRMLARRRLSEMGTWEPSPRARSIFLRQALQIASRPHERVAGEGGFLD